MNTHADTDTAFRAGPSDASIRSFADPYVPLAVTGTGIRTIVGTRPYRRPGFVLRRECDGERVLIHNYGHGGCGVTLSFGCAEMVARLLEPDDPESAAVLGGGVVGLTTAIALLKRGKSVTIYADAFPPHTTSDVAGALWYPVTLYDPAVATPEFLAQFRLAASLSFERFRELAANGYAGVSWMRYHDLAEEPAHLPPLVPEEGVAVYPGREIVQGPDAPFGYGWALRYRALMIDPTVFLPYLMASIERAGGKLVHRQFDCLDDVRELHEDLVFNCMGYGARALFGDDELIPVKGQLALLPPNPDIDYGYAFGRGDDRYLYMFPRREEIILGGTKLMHDASLDADENETQRIIRGHHEIACRIRVHGGAA